VFGQCDGRSSVREIAERLPHALNLPSGPDIVLLALRQLRKIHLLAGESTDFTFDELPSRRERVAKLGVLGVTATALLPTVMSVVAPTPAMAQSGDSYAGPENGNGNGNGNGVGEQNSNGHGHPHS